MDGVCPTPHCWRSGRAVTLRNSVTRQSSRTRQDPREQESRLHGRAGARHPHHRGQARGSAPPYRRGDARRLRARGGEAARQGQADRAGANRTPPRRGFVRRARRARPPPVDQLQPGEDPPLRRRRRHGVRHGRGPSGGRLLAGLHRLRRRPGRGLRREDRQGHGLGDEDRLPDHRHQRLRRRPHPGGCGLTGHVRRDLPPQHPRLRCDPADLVDRGPVRGRARCTRRPSRTSW
ncbi:hypothetical protein M2266_004490 [Streptomyces sp. SPB162]|nr:hypothetical protein [Streptomyces sp. SPB162]